MQFEAEWGSIGRMKNFWLRKRLESVFEGVVNALIWACSHSRMNTLTACALLDIRKDLGLNNSNIPSVSILDATNPSPTPDSVALLNMDNLFKTPMNKGRFLNVKSAKICRRIPW